MDIQRKAFESSNNVNPDWSFKFDEELQQYVATDFEMTSQVDEFNEHWDTFRAGWEATKAQVVPEGFVLVPREMQWHKADDLACLEWGRHVGLFCSENRDMSALQVEEFRLRWCKNKANKIMSDYKAMIEAQEKTND